MNENTLSTKIDFPTGTNPQSVAVSDLNNDGKPDVVVTNYNNSNISAFRNTSASGAISFAARLNFATGAEPIDIEVVDIDGDGLPDLAVANSSGTVSILRNTSSGNSISFTAKVDFAIDSDLDSNPSYPLMLTSGDLNGDGRPDLVVISDGGNNVFSRTSQHSTTGSITFNPKIDFSIGFAPADIALGRCGWKRKR
ncbi:MAG: VCBS repeat-containing protein [Bacteroidota bacterium]